MRYDMSGFMQQCVDRYLDCVGELGLSTSFLAKVKAAGTPFLDIEDGPDEPSDGVLSSAACKVLMKILYGARACRFDLLRPIAYLATRITKWSKACDKLLHRLVCYIAATKEYQLEGYVGDAADKLKITVWSDADFAGCKVTKRSTSGVFIAITGPNTFFPLNAISKKQSCVSHSTPEAELVALALSIRTEGIPSQLLWDVVFDRRVHLQIMEDNQPAIQVVKTGKNPNMRHMSRTHGVCHMWIHETVSNPEMHCSIEHCETTAMAADVFTKPFFDVQKWNHAISLIGIKAPLKKAYEPSRQTAAGGA